MHNVQRNPVLYAADDDWESETDHFFAQPRFKEHEIHAYWNLKGSAAWPLVSEDSVCHPGFHFEIPFVPLEAVWEDSLWVLRFDLPCPFFSL